MNLGKVRFEVSEYLKIQRVPYCHGTREWFKRKSKDASQIVTLQTVSEKPKGGADGTRGWEREAVAGKDTQQSVTEVSVKFNKWLVCWCFEGTTKGSGMIKGWRLLKEVWDELEEDHCPGTKVSSADL